MTPFAVIFVSLPCLEPLVADMLVADMQQAQLLMVAGFVMLGWVLARRQIKMRKRVNQDARAANQAIKHIREHKTPAVPLADAPPETQRWQAAMFDLQRELKAELDTRITVVQTLLRQVDARIELLQSLQSSDGRREGGNRPALYSPVLNPPQQQVVTELLESGHTAEQIAVATGLPVGDIELAISTRSS